MSRVCSDCGTEVGRRAIRCRPCAAKDVGKRATGSVRPSAGPELRPMPDDFAAIAPGMSMADLKKHYRCRSAVIGRWRREAGISGLPAGPKNLPANCLPTPVPRDFAIVGPTLTIDELSSHYGRSTRIVRRWVAESGVQPQSKPRTARKLNVITRPMGVVVQIRHDQRDHSLAGQAADYLRRFGPVARCRADGSYDAKGDYWRRNTTVLSADEIIDRAKRQGWQPNAWRMVA